METQWEGVNLPRSQWEEFKNGELWKAFLFEIAEREAFLLECFKQGDADWSAEMLRGKLTELDFIRNIPGLLLVSILETEKEKENAD